MEAQAVALESTRQLKRISDKVEASRTASSSSGIKRNYHGEEVGSVPLVSPRTQLADSLTRTHL